MTILHIEHPMTDFGTWRAAYKRLEGSLSDGVVLAARTHDPSTTTRSS